MMPISGNMPVKSPINLKEFFPLIYVEGVFGKEARKKFPMRAKTADGILRYAKYPILGVVDSKCTEKTVGEVLGNYVRGSSHENLPIFQSLKEAVKELKPTVLILGAAPEGGELPQEWEEDIKEALNLGMHIVSGMHFSLKSKFGDLAKTKKCIIWDVRTDFDLAGIPVGSALAYHIKKPIILTVGTDAAIGKMTVAYELSKEAEKRGLKSCIIPTGQTCMMIEGWGTAIDALPADFMAGAVEQMLLEKENDYDIFFVEGQGSLFHPGFSNTSISLLHGAVPSHMVLVHRPIRKHSIGSKLVKLPTINEAIEVYEKMVLPPYRGTKVIAVALNTAGMKEEEITQEQERIAKETSLPVGDVVLDSDFVREVIDNILG